MRIKCRNHKDKRKQCKAFISHFTVTIKEEIISKYIFRFYIILKQRDKYIFILNRKCLVSKLTLVFSSYRH